MIILNLQFFFFFIPKLQNYKILTKLEFVKDTDITSIVIPVVFFLKKTQNKLLKQKNLLTDSYKTVCKKIWR